MTGLTTFSPKDEQPIPFWPLPDPPPSYEERVYVIGLDTSERRLKYYFVERPKYPDASQDGPLQIRVPQDCTIVLRLSNDWNWEFNQEHAVTLGPMTYPEKPRYFNLVPVVEGGRCTEVKFNALHLSDADNNRDCYAIYVNLYDDDAAAPSANAMMIRIDPDILNPGGRPSE